MHERRCTLWNGRKRTGPRHQGCYLPTLWSHPGLRRSLWENAKHWFSHQRRLKASSVSLKREEWNENGVIQQIKITRKMRSTTDTETSRKRIILQCDQRLRNVLYEKENKLDIKTQTWKSALIKETDEKATEAWEGREQSGSRWKIQEVGQNHSKQSPSGGKKKI